MVVTCPSCGMRYRRPERVPPETLTARCARCGSSFALPPAIASYRLGPPRIAAAAALASGGAAVSLPGTGRLDPIAHLEAALDEIGPVVPQVARSADVTAQVGARAAAPDSGLTRAAGMARPLESVVEPAPAARRQLFPDLGGVVQATLLGAAAGWVFAPEVFGLLWVGPLTGATAAFLAAWGCSLWAARRS